MALTDPGDLQETVSGPISSLMAPKSSPIHCPVKWVSAVNGSRSLVESLQTSVRAWLLGEIEKPSVYSRERERGDKAATQWAGHDPRLCMACRDNQNQRAEEGFTPLTL